MLGTRLLWQLKDVKTDGCIMAFFGSDLPVTNHFIIICQKPETTKKTARQNTRNTFLSLAQVWRSTNSKQNNNTPFNYKDSEQKHLHVFYIFRHTCTASLHDLKDAVHTLFMTWKLQSILFSFSSWPKGCNPYSDGLELFWTMSWQLPELPVLCWALHSNSLLTSFWSFLQHQCWLAVAGSWMHGESDSALKWLYFASLILTVHSCLSWYMIPGHQINESAEWHHLKILFRINQCFTLSLRFQFKLTIYKWHLSEENMEVGIQAFGAEYKLNRYITLHSDLLKFCDQQPGIIYNH